MTKQGKRRLVIVLDRSGSMMNIRTDMEGGMRTFLEEQAQVPGETSVSLYQFDDQYEAVYENVPITETPAFELRPRGGTALLDAVGRTITTVGKQLADTPEHERPEHVVVCIVSDGLENASREYDHSTVKSMVEHQQTVYSWAFTYLGANQDAITVGASMGVSRRMSMSLSATGIKKGAAFGTLSANVTRGTTGQGYGYTQQERDEAGEGGTP